MTTFTHTTTHWDQIVTADLQAHYELGLLAYPNWRPPAMARPLEQGAWREGWDDAKDLADCEHFDHRPQKTAMGMTI